jgi:CRP-like cAMP-binding protein
MAIDPHLLEQFEALEPLGAEGRARMAPILKSTTYRTGAQIIREGDEGDASYLLAEGHVVVIKNLPDGRKVKLATLPAGTLFGQAGLVPGQVRTADVRAEGNVTVFALDRPTLEWAMGRGEGWAVAMQALVAVGLVRQLRSALERLGELAAAEDASAEITGRKRSEIKGPTGLNATFDGARARARAATDAPAFEEEQREEQPQAVGGLLELLRSTEKALASAGFDAEAVQFVFDDDQMRTAEARGT